MIRMGYAEHESAREFVILKVGKFFPWFLNFNRHDVL